MSEQAPSAGKRFARTAFVAMALASVLFGSALFLLRDAIGLPDGTARIISTVFILLGVADFMVVLFWERVFKG